MRLLLALLLAAPAAADAGRDLFDAGASAAPALPEAPAPLQGVAQPVPPRPASDLYYFTPDEAAQAAKAQAFSPQLFGSRGFKFDPDVPPDVQAQMLGDLAFAASIKGGAGSPLHRRIFGAVDGAVYKDYFETRVHNVGMSDCGNGNAVACVIPMMGRSHMWLTQNYVRFSHPQVARLMIVYHEARHTEISHLFWGHAKCPTPFNDAQGNPMRSIWTGASLAGEPACDKTPLGSYGSSGIMLSNIARSCTNCTDKVKMDAALYADDDLGRITDPGARRQMEEDYRL